MFNLTAIAAKFNVLQIAITRVEEWANCVFVVIKGIGARFVSKKVGLQQVTAKAEPLPTSKELTTKELRQMLVKAFPGVKLSVRKMKSWAYDGLDVFVYADWETKEKVEKFCKPLQVIRTCPTTGRCLSGGNFFIGVQQM